MRSGSRTQNFQMKAPGLGGKVVEVPFNNNIPDLAAAAPKIVEMLVFSGFGETAKLLATRSCGPPKSSVFAGWRVGAV